MDLRNIYARGRLPSHLLLGGSSTHLVRGWISWRQAMIAISLAGLRWMVWLTARAFTSTRQISPQGIYFSLSPAAASHRRWVNTNWGWVLLVPFRCVTQWQLHLPSHPYFPRCGLMPQYTAPRMSNT